MKCLCSSTQNSLRFRGLVQCKNSLALVSALADFLVKIHLDLQYELQLFVGDKSSQGAVDFLTSIHSLPVVLIPQVHFVAAGRFLIVVPPTGAFLCRRKDTLANLVCSHDADSTTMKSTMMKRAAYC